MYYGLKKSEIDDKVKFLQIQILVSSEQINQMLINNTIP